MRPLIIDIAFELPDVIRALLEKRIRQVVFEPSVKLIFVQVKIAPASIIEERVAGQVYRITLCGVGGVALADEREFLLFQKAETEPLQLQYIQKRSDV